ncbi:hypothetical protein [Halorussus amylolyticus]|uniref:hypothetical protein n=1 Tax=Halorussus amylolyticus TaxID=1126242 RepID=UPI00138ED4A0|nr:hypothetical protein [Halorussus amylolyticus]
MSEDETCERHAWASVGVVTRAGSVCRIWECENCPVWTAEQFDPDHERLWADTWLAER